VINPRLLLAILTGKLTALAIKLSKKSGGTALPGLLTLKIEPDFLAKLANSFPSIVISGTNGKTTTARIISSILEEKKLNIIHNRAGSNLERGIVSTLLKHSSLFGHVQADFGLWETDEAALPKILAKVKPRVIILTNLFRDQLDRYGEVDTLRKNWLTALKKLSGKTTIVLNADDPGIAHLGHNLNCQVIYFGLEDKNVCQGDLSRSADTKYCAYCTTPLTFEIVFASHLGKYFCPKCQKRRPETQVFAQNIKLQGAEESKLSLFLNNHHLPITFQAGGLYNIYNLLAAAAVASALKIPDNQIKNGIEKFTTAFGRIEKIEIEGKKIFLFLVKNPTGFNEVIRTIFADPKPKKILIAVNDLIADGRDISWLWDVDFEKLVGKISLAVISGTRAKDMNLRLKYAGVKSKTWEIDNLKKAIHMAIKQTKKGESIYFLPTYTAMLETKKILAQMGHTESFWEN